MSGTAYPMASVACVFGPVRRYIVTLAVENGSHTLAVTGNEVSLYSGGPYLPQYDRTRLESVALRVVDALRDAYLVGERAAS